MAYTPDTLCLVATGVEGRTPNLWTYVTTDGDGTITGAAYFSDGDKKGMKVGDFVDAINATGPKYKKYQVTTVTAGTGATVAAPTAIT
jgi:hypothetical protein